MDSKTFFSNIRDLIARDELAAALLQLRTLLENSPKLDEALLQSAHFHDIQKQIRLGTISHAEANLTQNQIRGGLLDLLREIEDSTGLSDQVISSYPVTILREELERAISVTNSKNVVASSTISAGGNVEIGDKISISVKGALSLALIGLLAIGIWQKDTLATFFGFDHFFSDKDENFKILVLPFKQLCEQGGKNYDAGYVLSERLQAIAIKENLKIRVKYWDDYDLTAFEDQKARELQQYHHTDMIIYGVYQTSACSAEGDQICLNYITDEKWNLGKAGLNLEKDYQKGGLDDLKKGKLQEKIENIALFVSILAQIKSLDHIQYLKKLQELLSAPDFDKSSKAYVLLELANKLFEEGKLEEPLRHFEQALNISLESGDKMLQGICLERLGETHNTLGNLPQALTFFEQFNGLEKELNESYPQNVEFKNGLAISYSRLGDTHSALGNLPQALTFFEERSRLEKELHEAYPQNVGFKNGLAISYAKLGEIHSALGNLPQALTFFEQYNGLEIELYKAYPQNVEFKNGSAISYEKLGEIQSALGKLPKALTFFEQGIKLFKELHEAYPQNMSFKNGLAISYSKLGETHSRLGNLPKALTFFEERSRLEKELHEAYPQNVNFKSRLAISYSRLGEIQSELGHLPKALTFFEQGIKLFKELHETYLQNVEFNNNLAASYAKLGETHSALGDLPQALTFFEELNALEQELHEVYPQNVDFKKGLAISYSQLGLFFRDKKGDPQKAKEYFQQCFTLWKELSEAYPDYAEFRKNFEWAKKALED